MTAGLTLGLTRAGAARFSFLLSVPVIVLAGALKTLEPVKGKAEVVVSNLLLGTLVSGVSAYPCIHFFLKLLERVGMLPHRHHGPDKRISIGVYPEVGRSAARAARDDTLALMRGSLLCGSYRGRLSAGGLGRMLRPSAVRSRADAGRVSFRERHMVARPMAAIGRCRTIRKFHAAVTRLSSASPQRGGLAVISIAA